MSYTTLQSFQDQTDSAMDALKGVTAGVVDVAGDTLDTAGETLNKAADDIQGTEATSTETGTTVTLSQQH